MKPIKILGFVIVSVVTLAACGLQQGPIEPEIDIPTFTSTEVQEMTATATHTKTPTEKTTFTPTYTPTDMPTQIPTETPTASPTATLTITATSPPPTATTAPAQAPSGNYSCMEQTPGTLKIRVNNNSGDYVGMYLSGPANYSCSVPPGAQFIYVKSGSYSISLAMCGGMVSGVHVINPGWRFTLKCD